MTDVLQILPPPFAWCNIPAGQIAIAGAVYDVMPFEIAKYPITNAQFRTFMDADDGYNDLFWWQFSLEAKAWLQDDHYLATFGRVISDDDYPCMNVCWYEAVAFCRWLDARLISSAKEEAGEYLSRQRVMLPNEAQWQWAAAGSTGWAYPWGNKFDAAKCNSSVGERSHVTTKVNHYEGIGDSPFGVVDMCGNVDEWLVNRRKDINDVGLMSSEDRAIRGGNWFDNTSDSLQVNKRNWIMPYVIFDSTGFRIARY